MRNQRSKNPIATVVYEKGLEMERNQGCCYVLDEINGLEMERNQGCCYPLDEIDGLEMEKIRDAVTS